MKLKVFKEVSARVPSKKLEALFKAVIGAEKPGEWTGTINLVFTGDSQMKKLNRQFRGLAKTTDVLSFNVDQPVSAESVFGEIYISVPTADKQAESYGGTFAEEYLRLACHGLLHLFGYDHIKQKDAAQMSEREEYYLGRL